MKTVAQIVRTILAIRRTTVPATAVLTTVVAAPEVEEVAVDAGGPTTVAAGIIPAVGAPTTAGADAVAAAMEATETTDRVDKIENQ